MLVYELQQFINMRKTIIRFHPRGYSNCIFVVKY